MAKMKDALDEARAHAQELHKKIDEAGAKNQAAIRAEMQEAQGQVGKLLTELKAAGQGQRDETKRHVTEAITLLEDAGNRARDAASSGEERIKENNRAVLSKVRAATQQLSEAVASRRSSMTKV